MNSASLDLPSLQKIAERATPGPWFDLQKPWFDSEDIGILAGDPDPHVGKWIADLSMYFFDETLGNQNARNDEIFISTFNPQTALALIARIRRLEWALAVIASDLECRHYVHARNALESEAPQGEG